MDHTKAVNAHLTWIGDVWNRVERGDLPDPEIVGCDDRCEIGRWIHGAGQAYRGRPEFEEFRRRHAGFHSCVKRAVLKAQDGDRRAALMDLETGGACVERSEELLEAAFDFFESIRTGDGR